MLHLTKNDIGSKIVFIDNQPRKCPNCGGVDKWHPSGCQQCGTKDLPNYVCDCGGTFNKDCYVKYMAVGAGTTQITRTYSSDKCQKCSKVLLYGFFIEELEDFVKSVPTDFCIIPEVGISTPNFLEILIDSHSSYENIIKRSHGISIRLGGSSKLFDKALNYVTDYDLSDYGHDCSPTLIVKPGPPYSFEQRKILHVLLSRMRKEIKCPLNFW